MVDLPSRFKTALDEGRILILGTQVLVGFHYQSVFLPRFRTVSSTWQLVDAAGLGVLMVALGLLMTPIPFHHISEGGHVTWKMERLVRRVLPAALFPLALALGIDLFLASVLVTSRSGAIAIGAGTFAIALSLWYGIEALRKRSPEHEEFSMPTGQAAEPSPLADRVNAVLTEARVVLPGAQALLGFQFASVLTQTFAELPSSSRSVHLVSLILIALSIILLMTPAAYHRIVERGENTEHFHRIAGRLVIASMPPLALGIGGDLFVVLRLITGNGRLAAWLAILALVGLHAWWFGWTGWRRWRRSARSAGTSG